MNRIRLILMSAVLAGLSCVTYGADGATALLPADAASAFKLSGSAAQSAKMSTASVKGQTFGTALRIEVAAKPQRAADVQIAVPDPGRGRSNAPPASHAAAAFRLQATLGGEPFDAQRHGVKVLIKAVTYHALEVREDPDGWQATVVFDI